MWGGPQDVFLGFEFRVDHSPNFGATGVKNRPFPLTRHIAYTTACSYRSSCDKLTNSKYETAKRVLRLHPLTSHRNSSFHYHIQQRCQLYNREHTTLLTNARLAGWPSPVTQSRD